MRSPQGLGRLNRTTRSGPSPMIQSRLACTAYVTKASPDCFGELAMWMARKRGGKCNQTENLDALWRGCYCLQQRGQPLSCSRKRPGTCLSLTARSVHLHACKHHWCIDSVFNSQYNPFLQPVVATCDCPLQIMADKTFNPRDLVIVSALRSEETAPDARCNNGAPCRFRNPMSTSRVGHFKIQLIGRPSPPCGTTRGLQTPVQRCCALEFPERATWRKLRSRCCRFG